MEDREILALFNTRSEAALTEAADKYGTYCRAVARRALTDESDVDECLNDTYLAAWNSIPPHQPQCLRTYLGRLTRNLSLHRYEALQTKKRGGGEVTAVLSELEECLPSGRDTAREVELHELKEVLERFLDSLPADARWVFIRRCWYMDPIAEIAASLGIREGYAKVILHRTRKKLKSVLQREGVEL